MLNYRVLDYPLGAVPALNWLLYGYGIPAAAFFIAARWFRRAADDLLVQVLEAGALVFAVLLVSLEIRSLVAGRLDSWRYGLLEQSLQWIAWLAASYGLMLANRRHDRPVLRWGWQMLATLATLQVVLLQLIARNPLWTRTEIGEMLLLDLLLLAYVVPAVFAFLFARRLPEVAHRGLAVAAAVLGLLLVFAYLTLEVRHAFHGAILRGGPTTDAEWYSYSVVWLVYAGSLLALGFLRRNAQLRHAALAIVALTVVKVFVWDMAELTGLYRAASFLGLGLSLVGIGYFYQRFVLPSPGPGEADRRRARVLRPSRRSPRSIKHCRVHSICPGRNGRSGLRDHDRGRRCRPRAGRSATGSTLGGRVWQHERRHGQQDTNPRSATLRTGTGDAGHPQARGRVASSGRLAALAVWLARSRRG